MPERTAKNITKAATANRIVRTIPNCLSIIRIALSLCLIAIKPISIIFYIIYIICGISDMLDGFIARRTGACSDLGARFDTMADLIMIVVLFIKLYPVFRLPGDIVIWITLIFAVRMVAIITALVKHKTFAILHTYSNKFTGILLFLAPVFLLFCSSNFWMYVVCGAASLSAAEELLIQLTLKDLQLDRKSLFS